MNEKPILFHATSIRGILEGRKVQTRRIIKNPPTGLRDLQSEHARNIRVVDGGIKCDWFAGEYTIPLKSRYGVSGDRLWVKEAWLPRNAGTLYKADYEPTEAAGLAGMYSPKGKWKPSMLMPRWASRLTLEITNIRVERVQQISDRDCEAEGVRPSIDGDAKDWRENENGWHRTFRQLWDDTNGSGAWDRNDWVWVIDFKRVPQNA